MATTDLRTNFASKRNLPQQRLKDTFFDYLEAQLREVTSRVWSSQRGVFGLAALGAAVDEVSVSGLPVELLDGDGNLLVLAGTNGTSLKIENALAATYEIAARHVLVPSGVERNPRNDVINYDTWEDQIGESADPQSLVEVASQLNMIVDPIFENAVSHAGRLVTVYLKAPASSVEATAIERNAVVTWDGSNNRILTGGLLGQPSGGASVAPSDYVVVAQGLTIRRNTTLSTLTPYAFIGTATGVGVGGVPTVSTVGQVDVSDGINSTLDETYNNSGEGKRITLDDEAVELETPASSTGDLENAQLRLVRFGNTDWMQFMLVLQIGDLSSIPICVMQKIRGLGGVLEDNAATASGAGSLTFVGTALDADALRLNERWNFALVTSGVAAEQGLYMIVAGTILPLSFDVFDLQGGAPTSWTAEVKTVSLMQVNFMVAGGNIHAGGGPVAELIEGMSYFCRDGQGFERPFRIFGHGATGNAMEWYDNAPRSDGDANDGARLAGSFSPDQVGVVGGYVWKFGRPVRIDAGAVGTGGGEPAFYARDAVRLFRGGGDYNTFAPKLGLAIEDGSVGVQPAAGGFKGGLTSEGMQVSGHRFRDDFVYSQWTWTGPTIEGIPPHYSVNQVLGSGGAHAKTSFADDGAGSVEVFAAATLDCETEFAGPLFMSIDSSRGHQWRFNALVRLRDVVDCRYVVGLFDLSVQLDAWFEFESGVNGGKWRFRYRDDTQTIVNVDTGLSAAVEWVNLHISQLGSRTWFWAVSTKAVQLDGVEDVGPALVGGEFNFANVGSLGMWQPLVSVKNKAALVIKKILVDMWEMQDVGNPIHGPLFNERQD